jgi:hypothetical protein
MPALTDTAIRTAKPKDKPYKLRDSGNLYLLIAPAGGKLWRMDYRFDGKRKLLALGKYPEVGLKEARERQDEARKLLANGADPGAVKKARKTAKLERAANSFEVVAHKWFEKWKTGVTDSTAKSQRERLAKHIMPSLGTYPIADITSPKIIAALRPLEAHGTGDTLRKAKMAISQIMDFAVQNEWIGHNPAPSLRGIFKAAPVKHMAAILNPVALGAVTGHRCLRRLTVCHGRLEAPAAGIRAPWRATRREVDGC